jgi:hypothetical protein
MGSFSGWRPTLAFPHTKQYIDFNGTNKFPFFLGLLGREHGLEAWKTEQQSHLKHQRIAISSK